MPLAALASFPPCYDVTNCATLRYTVDKMLAGGASEASGLMYNDTNTYQYQNICLAVERQLSKCTLHADNGATLCHTICINDRET